MPYCPKCDMEFVDGITLCSDCGGELVESQEAYEFQMRELKKLQQIENLAGRYQEIEELDASELMNSLADFEKQEGLPAETPELAEPQTRPKTACAGVYVSSRRRCEDLRSSSSAFLVVGGASLVFAVLCWAGIVSLPMADGSKLLSQSVTTLLGLACLFVSFRTRSAIVSMEKQASEEERCTKELIEWFTASWSGSRLDEELKKEDPELTGEEMELKRFELIQDFLITGQDLPNQAYVDALSEEIYHILYENAAGQ